MRAGLDQPAARGIAPRRSWNLGSTHGMSAVRGDHKGGMTKPTGQV
ncbi:MAG: hypothetical protein KTR25_11475 [Myxococcales bacterium]|nr:hypothetical protein [Myxococcales bacterium]